MTVDIKVNKKAKVTDEEMRAAETMGYTIMSLKLLQMYNGIVFDQPCGYVFTPLRFLGGE